MQKENKISDRIQDKLNIIRNGYEMRATSSTDINKRRDHTPITGKKIKNEVGKLTSNSKKDQNKVERISFIQKRLTQPNEESNQELEESKDNQPLPTFYQPHNKDNNNNSNKSGNFYKNAMGKNPQSRINADPTSIGSGPNTSISNQSVIISEVKQMGNKSVLIVKPNQLGMNTDCSNLSQSRNSKRKFYEHDNKQNRYSLNKDKQNRFSLNKETKQSTNKENVSYLKNSKVSNFFRNDNNGSITQKCSTTTDRQMKILKRQDNNAPTAINKSSQNCMYGNKFSSTSLSNKTNSAMNSKIRSSSTRVIRKEELSSSTNSIGKIQNYASKGKWKM